MEEAQDHKKKKTTLYKERREEKRANFLKKRETIAVEKREYLDKSGIHQYVYTRKI
jgi:hypothetical protein